MLRTLSARLTLWYILASAILLILAFGSMYLSIDKILDYRMDEDLIEDIDEFSLLLDQEGLDRVKLEIQREIHADDLDTGFLRLVDSGGGEIFSSDTSGFSQSPVSFIAPNQLHSVAEPRFQTTKREFTFKDESDQESYREIIAPIGNGMFLHISESREEKKELMEALSFSLIVLLGLALPAAALVGWTISRRAVRGVEEVSQIAEKIHRGQLDERVKIKAGEEEIVRLSSTFNAMLDRIRDLVREMREMMDNIAHDLKSPLARIRILSEDILARDKTAEQCRAMAGETIEECDRLLKMINDSLDVAEAEAGIGVRGNQTFNLSELVSEMCELFQPVAELKDIRLVCKIHPGCMYTGNQQVFQRTIANLVDNAIKYTDSGGRVNLSLDYQDGAIEINVADTGVGISQIDQQKVFNRFYRCDNSRSRDGCGLGLNYSRAVARSHGGDIQLSSVPHQGSIFTLSLPRIQTA